APSPPCGRARSPSSRRWSAEHPTAVPSALTSYPDLSGASATVRFIFLPALVCVRCAPGDYPLLPRTPVSPEGFGGYRTKSPISGSAPLRIGVGDASRAGQSVDVPADPFRPGQISTLQEIQDRGLGVGLLTGIGVAEQGQVAVLAGRPLRLGRIQRGFCEPFRFRHRVGVEAGFGDAVVTEPETEAHRLL